MTTVFRIHLDRMDGKPFDKTRLAEKVRRHRRGGYDGQGFQQIASKESHVGHELGLEDIRTYCRIITALNRTIEIQEEIDGLYEAAEAETISVSDAP